MIEPGDLSSLCRLLHLKKVQRTGWTRHPIDTGAVESVADHSYGVALLALLVCPSELDRSRVLELALIHDLAEVVTGDLTPEDGVDSDVKYASERAALEELIGFHSDKERYLGLLDEYQNCSSPEARFVKSVDKLEMALQSLVYEDDFDVCLQEFRDSAGPWLKPFALDAKVSRGKNDPV